jgi:hypothetical protein
VKYAHYSFQRGGDKLEMNPSVPKKRKTRVELTPVEKAELIRKLEEGDPHYSRGDAVRDTGLSKQAISAMMKPEARKKLDGILAENSGAKRKYRQRDIEHVEVDAALIMWFSDFRTNHPADPVTTESIYAQALYFQSAFEEEEGRQKISSDWILSFRRRYDIVFKRFHGESNDADGPAADFFVVRNILQIIAEFLPTEIFNGDECGLFWRTLQDGTFAMKNVSLLCLPLQ